MSRIVDIFAEKLIDMETHPDKDFVLENDAVFSAAYGGKCILIVNRRVVKDFDTVIDAMLYVESAMDSDNYILADYTGPDPNILYR